MSVPDKESITFSYASVQRVLDRLIQSCRSLCSLLEKEQALLVTNNKAGWPEVLERKRQILHEMGDIDADRRSLFDPLMKALAINEDDRLVEWMTQRLGARESHELKALYGDMIDGLRTIIRLNRQNASLLGHALYYNTYFLSALTGRGADNEDGRYGPSASAPPTPSQFVNKAV